MAEFKFSCPHCQQSLDVPQDMLGQTAQCPSCEGEIQLPEPAPVAPRIKVKTPVARVASSNDGTVAQIVHKYSTRIRDSHIYFGPQFPRKKLANALGFYAKGVGEKDVLAMVDNTVFGNAKDGAILTATAIYVHNQMEEPQQVELKDIETLSFAEGWTSILHINDAKFLEINMPEKPAMRKFTEMLREIVKALNPTTQPAAAPESPVEALKALKELHDNGLLTDEEFEAKRKQYVESL